MAAAGHDMPLHNVLPCAVPLFLSASEEAARSKVARRSTAAAVVRLRANLRFFGLVALVERHRVVWPLIRSEQSGPPPQPGELAGRGGLLP